MTIEELTKDPALLGQLEKEIKELAAAGTDREEAKKQTFAAHGIEIDADAENAAEVGRMKLDEEKLENVSGGNWFSSSADSCWVAYSCYAALLHDQDRVDQDCWSDYHCYVMSQNPEHYRENDGAL